MHFTPSFAHTRVLEYCEQSEGCEEGEDGNDHKQLHRRHNAAINVLETSMVVPFPPGTSTPQSRLNRKTRTHSRKKSRDMTLNTQTPHKQRALFASLFSFPSSSSYSPCRVLQYCFVLNFQFWTTHNRIVMALPSTSLPEKCPFFGFISISHFGMFVCVLIFHFAEVV